MIQSKYLDILRSAHQYQGITNDCGPFCTAIVLDALALLSVGGAEISHAMDKPLKIGIIPFPRRISNWATFPWGIVHIMKEHGLIARWRVFCKPALLKEILVKGYIPIPIVGSWKPLRSHYKILVAYDEQKGWGFIDPARAAGEVFWDSHDRFQKQWKNMACTCLVVDPSLSKSQ